MAPRDSRRIENPAARDDPGQPGMTRDGALVGRSMGSSELDAALGRALDAATAAGRFDVVEKIVAELGARRP